MKSTVQCLTPCKPLSLRRYTMSKSTATIFVLLFAILFKLEKPVGAHSYCLTVVCAERCFHCCNVSTVQTFVCVSVWRTDVLLGGSLVCNKVLSVMSE